MLQLKGEISDTSHKLKCEISRSHLDFDGGNYRGK